MSSRESRHVPLSYALASLFGLLLLQLANLHVQQTHAAEGYARRLAEQIAVAHNNKSEPIPSSTGPFRFPKLIHQTVVNKSRLSCQQQRVVQTWKDLNPGYTHRLWDDYDMRLFMVKFYPELIPTPYDDLLSGAERADIWRVLVLHKFGGVYADIDVECMKPIDTWNADHHHDASLLLGLEDWLPSRSPYKLHVNNWMLAAMPGHPLLALLPSIVTGTIQRQYFALIKQRQSGSHKLYEAGILDRTGPDALTAATYHFFQSIGFDLNNVTEADVNSRQGVVAGSARILPGASSTGWVVAEARAHHKNLTCADLMATKPDALVCHLFWGTWRSNWQAFKQDFTYDNC